MLIDGVVWFGLVHKEGDKCMAINTKEMVIWRDGRRKSQEKPPDPRDRFELM